MLDGTAQLMAWKLSLSYANPVGTATLTAAPFSEVRYRAGTKVSFNVIRSDARRDSAVDGVEAFAVVCQPGRDGDIDRCTFQRGALSRRYESVVQRHQI